MDGIFKRESRQSINPFQKHASNQIKFEGEWEKFNFIIEKYILLKYWLTLKTRCH